MGYLLRSMLFVPAYNEKFIEKALDSDADAIIFDLEDSVPAAKRAEARRILERYLLDERLCAKHIFVRVNELGTEDLVEDMQVMRGSYLTGVVAPKIRNVLDVEKFETYLAACEQRENRQVGELKLLPLIETAEAVLNVKEIAGSTERIIALLFGGEDFLDSIWGEHGNPPKAFDVPRAMIAMAARMHNILPIDTPYLELQNDAGFLAEEKESYSLGFAGALLVNPKQIPLANSCFMPAENEIEHAKSVYEAVETAKKEGKSIAMLDGKMIGPPMVKRALKVLEMDRLVKEKEIRVNVNR